MHSKTFQVRIILFVFLLAGLLAFIDIPASQADIRLVTGTVTKISDGDTFQLTTPEQTILKIRLYGIDAPETDKINHQTGKVNISGQPYGKESCDALKNKIMGKKVKVDILDIDKYRRMVGMIHMNDRNINLEMVTEGHAEAFMEYLKEPYRSQFLEVEQKAKSAKKGIWSLPNYERPRNFRKRLKVSGGE